MRNSNTSFIGTNIKNNKKIIIIFLCVIFLLILLTIFFATKQTPKSIVISFFKDLEKYDSDKIFSYIDLEKIVMLKETSNDFENLEYNLASLANKSEDERGNFKESVSYTERHIRALIDEFRNHSVFFVINSKNSSEIFDNIYKVDINVSVQGNITPITDNFTFYLEKTEDNYSIIGIYDEKYF